MEHVSPVNQYRKWSCFTRVCSCLRKNSLLSSVGLLVGWSFVLPSMPVVFIVQDSCNPGL